MTQQGDTILCVSINEQKSYIGIGTINGFYVFDINNPSKAKFHEKIGGVGLIELKGESQYLLLVGGGPNPFESPTVARFYDLQKHSFVSSNKYSYARAIRRIKMTKNDIFIALENNIDVYCEENVPTTFDTYDNPKGLFSVNYNVRKFAYPSITEGTITIHDLDNKTDIAVISAHEHSIYTLSPSFDSTIVTVSENGTLVRIWETTSGTLLKEFRRGMNPAHVYCVALSDDGKLVALHSENGTIHVFSLTEDIKNQIGWVAKGIGSLKWWFGVENNVSDYASLIIHDILPKTQTELYFLQSDYYKIGLFGLNGEYYESQLSLENQQLVNDMSAQIEKIELN
ncbi:WD repeat domain phosphoinositide-interacting protein, putative [Entamoeba dispar SAW760]|uniref:WD repeat domain phosphoinositide-interacting protein, putative n=1 Tax=Entamoeba dispar (strain ATCC PRA-260 / SAW760) TaxID=370354 RepID=B0EB33_ENTDS|nr:WD repeat domain phosphoinositide-interacting protein, putative [Entamoeba dispar SAW760]EDR28250.1 WD repeat domain phosphoinositide-interacting protein, putative [Entamoeba dispar SAW760]|eukprot:EDR28250.1 WD repeat domain phosphoinositide-interacting protein, putative [Entamoeba dispar SAW760]